MQVVGRASTAELAAWCEARVRCARWETSENDPPAGAGLSQDENRYRATDHGLRIAMRSPASTTDCFPTALAHQVDTNTGTGFEPHQLSINEPSTTSLTRTDSPPDSLDLTQDSGCAGPSELASASSRFAAL
jgi:hypothetical protein